MARLTITLSDETHRRLKVQAALEDKTIGAIIEEELAAAREAHRREALKILERVRRRAAKVTAEMTDEEIMDFAVEETLAARRELSEQRGPAPRNRR